MSVSVWGMVNTTFSESTLEEAHQGGRGREGQTVSIMYYSRDLHPLTRKNGLVNQVKYLLS